MSKTFEKACFRLEINTNTNTYTNTNITKNNNNNDNNNINNHLLQQHTDIHIDRFLLPSGLFLD